MDAATRAKYFPPKKPKSGSKKAKINKFRLTPIEVSYGKFKQNISFSQYALHKQCPLAWYGKYGKRIKKQEVPSINLVFGTALHTVLQEYLRISFDESGAKADEIDFTSRFHAEFQSEIAKTFEKSGEFSSPEEMMDYFLDGVAILNQFRSKRRSFFNLKNMILVGIELPLHHKVSDAFDNIGFLGYIDITFYDTVEDMFYIFDIKTSKRGWKYEKKDPGKINQVLLYKHYLSQQYDIDINKIKTVFLIVKRKIIEDAPFPISRIQWFEPANSSRTVASAVKEFTSFIEQCYKSDGSVNDERIYEARTGQNQLNCTFCPFKEDYTVCPLESRVT